MLVLERREAKGLSIKALSYLSGVSSSTLIGIERGESRIFPQTARRLAVALDVPVDQLSDYPW